MPADDIDPGNLPMRMAEAIGSHEWTDFPRSAHNQHNYYAECAVCQRDVLDMVEAALGVRDELVAHLSARAAAAEAKVAHAEEGAQLASERLAKVQQVLAEAKARADKAEQQVAAIRTLITEDYGTDYDDEDVPAAVERLMRHLNEHEANVLRLRQSKNEALERAQAAIDRVRRLQELTIAASCRVEAINQATDTLAVLDGPKQAETTTTPARETA